MQVRTVDNPVGKIVRKLYLPCLSCTRIVSEVKYHDEPGQMPCESPEIQHLVFDDC